MNKIKQNLLLILLSLSCLTINSASAATAKIGILVFDGFLTSDVTAPIEVFGAATKKAWFSSYEVVVISSTKNKTVVSEEWLKIIADNTIYDELKLDVLIVPSAYEMDNHLNNKDLIDYMKEAKSVSHPGWPVIVQALFYWVKQVFLMEKMQPPGRVAKRAC